MHVDRGARRAVELRHLETRGDAGVGQPAAAAARGGADADAPAGRQARAEGEKARRDVDHLVDVVALRSRRSARTSRGRRRAAPASAAGVRGAPRGCRPPIARSCRRSAACRRASALAATRSKVRDVLHVLEQQQEDVGLAFVEHVVDEVEASRGRPRCRSSRCSGTTDRFGRPRSKNAKPMPPLCEITATWPRRSRLRRNERRRARFHHRAEGRAQRRRRVGEAFGVRPAHRHVVALGDGADLVLQARGPPRPAPRRSRSSGWCAARMPALPQRSSSCGTNFAGMMRTARSAGSGSVVDRSDTPCRPCTSASLRLTG